MPRDIEQFGPAGTNPRPCANAHTTDRTIALTLVATAGVIAVLVVVTTRFRRGSLGDTSADALAARGAPRAEGLPGERGG